MAELDAGLRRHLEASPIFLRLGPRPRRRSHAPARRPGHRRRFVAERDGRAVAFLRIGPCATDVATIVRDPGTASVTAAFTRVRSCAAAEVASQPADAAAVDWAREAGYARWAVDHESANGEAARFWARHATPVAMSMSRGGSRRGSWA